MSSEKKSGSVSGMIKLGIILACYAVASCTVLAVVNYFTAPRIEINRINKANAMLRELFPEADNFQQVTDFTKPEGSVSVDALYIAYSEGSVIGGAVQVTGPTYDKATIITGIDRESKVKGLKFLELSDSPGYGQNANDPKYTVSSGETFYGQFKGKDASQGFAAGKTFDAISGATITSNGVASLMNTGTQLIASYLKEHDYE